MRLIDADAVEEITWQDPSYTDPLNVLTEVREKVRALPTIDAVPVIRCKDCKWWSPNRKTCIEWADYCFRESKNCILTHFACRESDYCSWARTGRKEE